MSLQAGTRVGAYTVEAQIGRGSMGTVYRAVHPDLHRTVAIKVLDGVANGVASAGRFRREAQAIAQLRHPNVLTVHDFGEFEGQSYMVLEYAPGGPLSNQLGEEPLPAARAIALLAGIAAGLDYAHSRGVVHRDVKPANILLTEEGTPLLADFGLVRLLEGNATLTTENSTSGTPAYMAPEQVANGAEAGPAADRYSFATIAYQLLAGRVPFGGHVMEMLYAHVNREPPPPSSWRPELSPAVDAVLLRGLAKDPDRRWESCTALVAALTEAVQDDVQPAPVVQPEEAPSERNRLVPLLLMGLFCALVASLLGLGLLLHKAPPAAAAHLRRPTAAAGHRSAPSPRPSPRARLAAARSTGRTATGTPGSGSSPARAAQSGAEGAPTPTPAAKGAPTPTPKPSPQPTPKPSPQPSPSPTPTPAPQPPGAPGTPTASVVKQNVLGVSTVKVSWTSPVSGGQPSGYEVMASSTLAGNKSVSVGDVNSVSMGLGAGTYRFRVRARNQAGWGPWSPSSASLVVA